MNKTQRKTFKEKQGGQEGKPLLPLLSPLTTLRFHSRSIHMKYGLEKRPVPSSLTLEAQLQDIEWVSPKAKTFITDIQARYEKIRKENGQGFLRKTPFDIQELAKRGPFVLANLLDIIADPYILPLPFTPPISEELYAAFVKLFKQAERGSLDSLDTVIHKYLKRPPAWHLQQAQHIEEAIAYLAFDRAVGMFALGRTNGMADKAEGQFFTSLISKTMAIRKTYTHPQITKGWSPPTTPTRFILHQFVSRLRRYLKDTTGHPGYTFLTAIVQVAPYTPPYRQYKYTTQDTIRKLFER